MRSGEPKKGKIDKNFDSVGGVFYSDCLRWTVVGANYTLLPETSDFLFGPDV